jgi:quercetin dioxygenase-like cupin family protein
MSAQLILQARPPVHLIGTHRLRLSLRHLFAFIFFTLSSWILFSSTTAAQNPYRVAGDHYHLILENQWFRATRVTYAPGETSPVHDHPKAAALIYVYLTDAGIMRFRHFTDDSRSHVIDRPPVTAGSVRFTRGAAEMHSVEYLGKISSDYITLELRTAAPIGVERLPPVLLDPGQSTARVQFENGQLRVVRVSCAAGEGCPDSDHPNDPAIVVVLSGPQKGDVKWSPERMEGPMQQIRLELKALPADATAEAMQRPHKSLK